MPVPASINDLSTTAGNNSPAGSESPTTTDDYLRTLSAFIALLRDNRQPLDPVLTALADQAVLGSADAAAARATIAAMADADADFTIIYPNGGSAASPASVASNSRYVETNPFSGYHVACRVEVQYGGSWGAPGWLDWDDPATGLTAVGVSAEQHAGSSIVVQTGKIGVLATGNLAGSTFGAIATQTSLPCRVKVWKIKGAF